MTLAISFSAQVVHSFPHQHRKPGGLTFSVVHTEVLRHLYVLLLWERRLQSGVIQGVKWGL